jgi:hypothetical protein
MLLVQNMAALKKQTKRVFVAALLLCLLEQFAVVAPAVIATSELDVI